MVGLRARGKQIRQFILDNVKSHPLDIASITSKNFRISRQAVNSHIKRLIEQGSLKAKGNTRNREYSLANQEDVTETFSLKGLEEDQVWRNYVMQYLGSITDNALDIWHYGFTEMLNNAIDHSEGDTVSISIEKNPLSTSIIIIDDGHGIFRRIQNILKLEDEKHAVLELSKGKLTTDPENHTGEGIFFSSRLFDEYAILSGGVYFSHEYNKPEDWIMEREKPESGTAVIMDLNNNTSRTVKSVFDQYTGTEDYGFDKTVVPVKLTKYGNERLVSRSQAKRLLSRVDRFRTVILDFEGVDRIGQAFADEVFRVFANNNPGVQLHFIKANNEVESMILRALTRKVETVQNSVST